MYYPSEEFDCGCLPHAFMERYRVADGPAIKVALFLLNAGSGDVESVADALSLPIDTVARAIVFWQSAGLLTDDPATIKKAAVSQKKKIDPQKVVLLEPVRKPLTQSQVSGMILANPEIAVLLQETQHLLGRPLDSLESRILLEIFEYDELPVDVILMIVAFCKPRESNKRRIIGTAARTATDWKERGIDNSETAETYIRLLELREARERQVAETLLLEKADFSKKQRSYIAQWFEEYNYSIDFVKEAYLRTGNSSVAYLNSVLKSWHQRGFKTIRDTRSVPSNAPAPTRKKQSKDGASLLKKAMKKKNGKEYAVNGIQ